MPSVNHNPQVAPFDKQVPAVKSPEKPQATESTRPADQNPELQTSEKFAAATATTGIGAAVTHVSLVDNLSEKAQNLGHQAKEAIKAHFAHPPEENLTKGLEKALEGARDGLEEFVDDITDGRMLRDARKETQRFVRDHFTEQSPAEKIKNAVKDTAEDVVDAAADLADDLKDGRLSKKISNKLEN